jgi:protein-S-isoprenylcysteine O-methyltransferase Ste14
METLDAATLQGVLLESAWWTARISAGIGLAIWFAGALVALARARAARAVEPGPPAAPAHRLPGATARAFAQGIALLAGGALAALTRGEAERLLVPAAQAAVCFLAAIAAPAGGVLAAWAAKTLGPAFVFPAEAKSGAPLVTHGPFGVVRHPLYLGIGLVVTAAALSIGSLSGTLVLAVLYFVASAWRARLEERVLAAAFGQAFRDYAARVRGFVPRV